MDLLGNPLLVYVRTTGGGAGAESAELLLPTQFGTDAAAVLGLFHASGCLWVQLGAVRFRLTPSGPGGAANWTGWVVCWSGLVNHRDRFGLSLEELPDRTLHYLQEIYGRGSVLTRSR